MIDEDNFFESTLNPKKAQKKNLGKNSNLWLSQHSTQGNNNLLSPNAPPFS
jgi:hypothetical protein